jgi:hypothetical protein
MANIGTFEKSGGECVVDSVTPAVNPMPSGDV